MSKSSGTSLKDAIKQFETAKNCVAADAEKARAHGWAASMRGGRVSRSTRQAQGVGPRFSALLVLSPGC